MGCMEELWAGEHLFIQQGQPGQGTSSEWKARRPGEATVPIPGGALGNKQNWTGLKRELVSHPFGHLCPKSLSGRTGRNSPFSITVTQAKVDPSPGIGETEVTLLAAKDPVMEQGTFFIQLQTTSRPWW